MSSRAVLGGYYGLMVVTCLLIGVSRVYLGMHSFSQVLLGYAYAVLCIYLYYAYFKERIQSMLYSLANNSRLPFSYWLLVVSIVNGISYSLYQWREASSPSYDYIQSNILQAGCTITTNKYLHHKCFISAG